MYLVPWIQYYISNILYLDTLSIPGHILVYTRTHIIFINKFVYVSEGVIYLTFLIVYGRQN